MMLMAVGGFTGSTRLQPHGEHIPLDRNGFPLKGGDLRELRGRPAALAVPMLRRVWVREIGPRKRGEGDPVIRRRNVPAVLPVIRGGVILPIPVWPAIPFIAVPCRGHNRRLLP